jgi:hypothetical protein
MQRRAFLTGLGASVAAYFGVGSFMGRASQDSGHAGVSSDSPPALSPGADPEGSAARAEPEEGPAPWAIVAPLSVGTDLGGGWRVQALSGLRRGAAELTLAHGSERATVHVCRREGSPSGLAHTEQLDLFLMNGADGLEVTAEGIGRAVRTAALRIEKRERGTLSELPPTLLSHSARLDAHGPASARHQIEVSRA